MEVKSKIYKWILVFIISMAGLILNSDAETLHAERLQDLQKVDPELLVRYGIDDTARYGRAMTVYIDCLGGTTTVDGEISVTLAQNGDHTICYTKKVTIPAKETLTVLIHTDLIDDYTQMRVVFESTKKDTRVEWDILLNAKNFHQYRLCGILTDAYDEKEFYNDFGNKWFYLDESNMPNEYRSLDMLDIIVVEEFDTAKLSKEQTLALYNWVQRGGTLVLSPGIQLYDYDNDGIFIEERELSFDLNDDLEALRGLKDEIYLYESEREDILMNNEKVLHSISWQKPYYLYVGDEMVSSSLIDGGDVEPVRKKVYAINDEDAKVFLSSESSDVLASTDLRKGKIIYSAIPLLREKSDIQHGIAETYLCYMILDHISEENKNRIRTEYNGYLNEDYLVMDVLSYEDEREIIHTNQLIFMIALYLFLLIPFTYSLLKYYKRSKYIWVAMPVLSFAFTCVMFWYGGKTRVEKPYFGYFDVKYVDNENKTAQGEIDFYVGLNNNKEFRFFMPNTNSIKYSNTQIIGYPFMSYYTMSSNKSYDTLVDFNDYKTGVLYDTDGILVTLKNSPAFKEMYYNASYEVEYERILDADIELYEDSVEGIVTNCSDETIMNAFIIADTLYVPVGDIESGEAIEINGDEALGLISTGLSGYVDEWSMEVLEELSASEVRQRSSTRSVLMQTVGNGKYYIVGYQDAPTSENPLKEVCTSDQSFGTSVLIVDVDTGQDDETEWFVSNIDQHLVSEYNTGYFAELRYMTSNVLDAVYQFPKESHVTSLIYSEMLNNIPSDSYYEIAQETYAFNHETEEFDLIFLSARDSETQVVAEESLTAYIDDDNTILVRYRYSGIESICMIPILSCYQEQCDDINAD